MEQHRVKDVIAMLEKAEASDIDEVVIGDRVYPTSVIRRLMSQLKVRIADRPIVRWHEFENLLITFEYEPPRVRLACDVVSIDEPEVI